jgi:proteic killer suppression protein
MIRSFAHKGLEKFYLTGSTAGIQAKHKDRLEVILKLLDRAEKINDLNLAGMNLHPLKGNMKGLCSVKVNANWRVTFRFHEGNAEILNYQDYH